MKIAVQLYGHLRTFERCLPTLRKFVLQHYDCDIFMHTWSVTEHGTKTWHNFAMKEIRQVDEALINALKEQYPIRSVLVEEQQPATNSIEIFCQHNGGKNSVSSAGVQYMLYSQSKANELRQAYEKEHGIRYDYVLVTRPDIAFYREFNFNLLHQELMVSKTPCARFCAINPQPMNQFALAIDNATDVLYTSTPDIIDRTTDLLNKIDLRQYKDEIWNPENLFNRHLMEHGIMTTPLNLLMRRDWEIIRETTPERNAAPKPAPKPAPGVSVNLAQDAVKLPALLRRYYRYKLLAQVTWGEKRKHYKKKLRAMKERIRPARRFRKSCL